MARPVLWRARIRAASWLNVEPGPNMMNETVWCGIA
jgi:hypothetical protein